MLSFLILINAVITLYIWILIAAAVFSWLAAFDVLNRSAPAVQLIGQALWRLTNPLLEPLRRVLPDLGGLDISPLVLILLLFFLRNLMWEMFA